MENKIQKTLKLVTLYLTQNKLMLNGDKIKITCGDKF